MLKALFILIFKVLKWIKFVSFLTSLLHPCVSISISEKDDLRFASYRLRPVDLHLLQDPVQFMLKPVFRAFKFPLSFGHARHLGPPNDGGAPQ